MLAILFVYGSLRPDCGGDFGEGQRRRLARESTIVGEATLHGRLIDLGHYPGLVEGDGIHPSGVVHGVVLALSTPATTLAWLDDYEAASGGGDAEYDRLVRRVRLASGGEREAWVYVSRSVPEGGPVVAGGRWNGRTSRA